jgi:hypothetical protein
MGVRLWVPGNSMCDVGLSYQQDCGIIRAPRQTSCVWTEYKRGGRHAENHIGDDEEKCILFHRGPVPQTLMADRGHIADHAILGSSLGPGCGYSWHVGRIAPIEFPFGSLLTDAGKLRFYLGQARFTQDPIPPKFFGCAGVAHVENLQDVLLHVGRNGFRHHVSRAPGRVRVPLREALWAVSRL